ncbi:hypothetical protein JOF55_004837 [Haloactinomyces albus]|uniref:Uncharacterized protein n=1 Tax=Haloactinomyces albus TaxID=1352928 RepID=A0AAE3ZGP2_9ACTN|nr:hypothetical protein [Haloactinomyces albus]
MSNRARKENAVVGKNSSAVLTQEIVDVHGAWVADQGRLVG